MPQSSNDGLPSELLQLIASRLRAVCAGVPDDEFASLVADVARVKLKYAGDQFANLLDQSVEWGITRKSD
jgi:hypothetical protein